MAFNHDFGIQLPIIRNLKIILVTDLSLTPLGPLHSTAQLAEPTYQ